MRIKQKLLILNDNDFNSGFGGQASFIKNLHPYLDREFDLTYLILPSYCFNQHVIPIRLLYFVRVWLYLLVNGRKVDFILSHTPEASVVVSYFKVPLIHIFHGNTNPVEKSVHWYGTYFKRVFTAFEKRIVKRAALLYTVGDFRPDAKKFFNPIYIANNLKNIDTSVKKDFVFAGRLEALKNVTLIVDIYNQLSVDQKNQHKFQIIGTGTQEQKLKKQVQRLGLSDNIIFHGLLKNEQAIELISKSAILLMASDYEGFPMVIAEALTVGTPVISTDVGDIRSIVKNDYNGLLLPLGFQTATYIEKINTILSNYPYFSENAKKSSEIFDAQQIAFSFISDCKKIFN